jgi:hypothetical protein
MIDLCPGEAAAPPASQPVGMQLVAAHGADTTAFARHASVAGRLRPTEVCHSPRFVLPPGRSRVARLCPDRVAST